MAKNKTPYFVNRWGDVTMVGGGSHRRLEDLNCALQAQDRYYEPQPGSASIGRSKETCINVDWQDVEYFRGMGWKVFKSQQQYLKQGYENWQRRRAHTDTRITRIGMTGIHMPEYTSQVSLVHLLETDLTGRGRPAKYDVHDVWLTGKDLPDGSGAVVCVKVHTEQPEYALYGWGYITEQWGALHDALRHFTHADSFYVDRATIHYYDDFKKVWERFNWAAGAWVEEGTDPSVSYGP